MHPDDRERAAAAFRAYIGGKLPKYEVEYRQRTKSDAWIWILSLGQIVAWDAEGRPLRMLGTHTDITERKLAEEERRARDQKMQQAQRLESLGVLAGGIAHDFNNLLAVIMGNASFVLQDISQITTARECLQEIMGASNRAADLCRQMLAYAGKGKMLVQSIDLSSLTNEMVGLLKSSISKSAILNLDIEPNLPAINGDATQMQQIVMNLVINASEALGDGNGMIHVSTGSMECSAAYLRGACLEGNPEAGSYVWIEVCDTGSGIDAEAQAHIFEPFFTTKFTGRGLGLSAVRGILQSHHGFLTLRSQPGQGSTFRVSFPAEKQKAAIPETPVVTPTHWKGSGTILLVDDEDSVRATGKKLLEWLGFQVLTARDGLDALKVYSEKGQNITLVLLDLTMPRLGGEETLRELRRINPQVRVVLSSGYAESEIAPRFADKGLTGILEKPFSIAQMQSHLRDALSSVPVASGVS
jgi:signal transduction histidine kinase/CheY-like chemotaxis protein